MNPQQLVSFVDATWTDSIVPTLCRYITIPNLSPLFDPQWQEHGHMDGAVSLFMEWVQQRSLPVTANVMRLPRRTPLLVLEVPGTTRETVLLYGHLDKQPPMEPWAEGLGPFTPVQRGDRLYGRGGADDGYALFASVTAIEALHRQGVAHPRCLILIEAGEESGSPDLEAYVEALSERIGQPSLVVCLDSGCGNYEQLWCTTSLRGLVMGTLTISLLTEGVHSGDGSGVVASSFRVMRTLLSRLEDESTGHIRPRGFHVDIPESRSAQAAVAAETLGEQVWRKLPTWPGTRPVASDPRELILNRTWRPALSITGADGLPPIKAAGNVLRPFTSVRVSLRVPPTCNAFDASKALKQLLEEHPPYGAHVNFIPDTPSPGWNAPVMESWLEHAVDQASREFFGRPPCSMGEGGSIPFMKMLGDRFPKAQFLITGVLGPQSNAHGPNEFLHLPTARKLTCCVAQVLAQHALR